MDERGTVAVAASDSGQQVLHAENGHDEGVVLRIKGLLGLGGVAIRADLKGGQAGHEGVGVVRANTPVNRRRVFAVAKARKLAPFEVLGGVHGGFRVLVVANERERRDCCQLRRRDLRETLGIDGANIVDVP